MFCLLKKNNKKKRYPIIYRPLVLFCLVDSISRVFLVSFLWLCESSFILIFPYHRQFIYEKKSRRYIYKCCFPVFLSGSNWVSTSSSTVLIRCHVSDLAILPSQSSDRSLAKSAKQMFPKHNQNNQTWRKNWKIASTKHNITAKYTLYYSIWRYHHNINRFSMNGSINRRSYWCETISRQ